MQVIRRRAQASNNDHLRQIVRLDVSPCYDLPSSVRALYSPRIYYALRHWATETRRALPREIYEEGRFFFQGHETCIGFGIVRLIPDLPEGATPSDLIEAVRTTDPRTLTMYLLEGTGELPPDRADAFRKLLAADPTKSKVGAALRGFTSPRRRRFEEILLDPTGAQERLVLFLEHYNEAVFVHQIDRLREPLAAAALLASDTLSVLPTLEAIERLTGGYTMSRDLPLRRLVLAPTVFLYPFAAIRIDEQRGDGLIMYGVPSEIVDAHEPAPIDARLSQTMKAMSDDNRLRILRLIVQRPRNGPEIVELLGLSQPTVHHHIAQLRAAELVRQERTRSGMRLTVREEGVKHLVGSLADLFGLSIPGFPGDGRNGGSQPVPRPVSHEDPNPPRRTRPRNV